jgi:hypothetical protein
MNSMQLVEDISAATFFAALGSANKRKNYFFCFFCFSWGCRYSAFVFCCISHFAFDYCFDFEMRTRGHFGYLYLLYMFSCFRFIFCIECESLTGILGFLELELEGLESCNINLKLKVEADSSTVTVNISLSMCRFSCQENNTDMGIGILNLIISH